MKKLKYKYVFAIVLVFLSCASAPKERARIGLQADILPLKEGWYLYDAERTFKGIEDEFNFAQTSGLSMRSEITSKYTGVVVRFEDGALYDPVMGIELLIDNNGIISSADNFSINGTLEDNGRFFWSGLRTEHGRLHSIFVKGILAPLPASVRGGREFDGIYHMIDTGTGRRQLARISDGFYTWNYLDEEDAGFTPWPILIQPDGTFSTSLEITTVMEMENISSMNYSSAVLIDGKVIPGKGISMEEVSLTAGMGNDKKEAPQIYAGTMIRFF